MPDPIPARTVANPAPRGRYGRLHTFPVRGYFHGMQQMTSRFTEALHQLHAEGDADALVACFSSDASLSKVDGNHRADGKGGARQFWEEYRAVFDDIEATFTHVVQGEDSVALEWTSRGSLRTGRSFSYRGVSVLEGVSAREASDLLFPGTPVRFPLRPVVAQSWAKGH